MSRDEIIRMAREAGLADSDGVVHAAYQLERFAELVRADEREECAKVCEQYGVGCFNNDDIICDVCADLIRARGRV